MDSIKQEEKEIVPMTPIPEMSPADIVLIPLDIEYEEKIEPKRNGSPI